MPIKEWELVQELIQVIDDFDNDEQRDFILSLFEFLDPNLPFLEQQSEEQQKWLYYLHEKFVNGDEESANEYYA